MSIIGKVQRVHAEISEEERLAQQAKLEKGDFTIDDFRKQFEQMKKMGPIKDVLGAMPGMDGLIPEGEDPEASVRRIQGIVDAMTKQERRNPDIIDISRRRRIAAGSGTEPHEIKQFLATFDHMRTIMRDMAKMSMWERLKMLTGLNKMGAFAPGGAKMLKSKGNTGHRKSAKERAEERKKKKKKRR
jgi:signal recognition particle subunit SRP54